MSKNEGTLDNLGDEAQRLIERYMSISDTMSQHAKAQLERKIWNALAPDKRKEWTRDYFLRAVFGISTWESKNRSALLGVGDNGAELWRRIEHERMSISTAVNLMIGAKRQYAAWPKKYPLLSDALTPVLAAYDELPVVKTLADGCVFRQAGTQRIPRRKATPVPSSNGATPKSPKELYTAIRHMVAGYVAAQLDDVDDGLADQMYADFEVDLKITIDMLKEKMQTYRRVAREQKTLSEYTMRKRMREAFEELAMDPPRPSASIDIAQVKRQYRKLASIYHPDKTPGVDLSRKFSAVTEAYHFICSYNETRQRNEATADNGTT
jgi:hypothetical protein